jgi:hypothetical protein
VETQVKALLGQDNAANHIILEDTKGVRSKMKLLNCFLGDGIVMMAISSGELDNLAKSSAQMIGAFETGKGGLFLVDFVALDHHTIITTGNLHLKSTNSTLYQTSESCVHIPCVKQM